MQKEVGTIREERIKVKVTRGVKSSQIATVYMESLFDIKWDNVTGGYNEVCNRYYLMAKIFLEDIIEGGIDCSGRHRYDRNGIKVVIFKKYNEKIFDIIKHKSQNEQPQVIKHKLSSKKLVLKTLAEQGTITRKELRNLILSDGFKPSTFLSLMKLLEKEKIIITEGSNQSCNQIIRLNEECVIKS